MEFKKTKIIKCEPHDDYTMWLQFDDGLSGEVDLKFLVGKGVFSVWNSIDFFKSAYIDKKSETVAWGNDLDLDPYVLREQILKSKHNGKFIY